MTEGERRGYAGAVDFDNGEPPQIARIEVDGHVGEAVWDDNGVCVRFDVGDDIRMYVLPFRGPSDVRAIVDMKETTSVEALLAMRFEAL